MNSSQYKKNLRTCYSCSKIEEARDLGISCGQGHYLHDDCLHQYFAYCLREENWEICLPIKCAVCKEELLVEKVIALMTHEEQAVYSEGSIYSQKAWNQDEEFVRCSYCKFGIFYTKNNVPLFMFCQAENCQKMSCNICHKECEEQEEYVDADEHEEGDYGEVGIHFKCEELGPLKKEIEDIIFEGSTNKCPHCGYRGQKDEACTHMTCMRCDQEWCYCCEKKQEELDVPEEGYLGHQMDWENNKKRCPLYLQDIAEENDEWPEDDMEAVQFYHREKTRFLLQEKFKKIEEDTVEALMKHFPGLLCGFSYEEIMKFELNEVLKGRIKGSV